MKKILALVLLLFVMSATVFTLGACNGDDVDEPKGPESDGKIVYNIKVVDAFGAPVPDMIVNLFLGEESVAVKMTNSDGEVKCSDDDALEAGNYTVKLVDPHNKPFYYNESSCILSDGKEDLTVTMYSTTDGLNTEQLYLSDSIGDEPIVAPSLQDGGYHLELDEGRNYFVFVPTARGRYQIKILDNPELSVGYYGAPYFVQNQDLATKTEGDAVFRTDEGLFFNIRSFNVGEDYASTSRYVLRIDCNESTDVIITVKCIGDIPPSVEELPWDDFTLQNAPDKYNTDDEAKLGYELKDLDITDENLTVVYNSRDGFYHLNTINGPLVLLKLTIDSNYLDSFLKITEATSFSGYVYDSDGNLVAKRNYHGMMLQYIEAASDTFGVYPLTEGLKNALVDIGNAWGWYQSGGVNNIFGDLSGEVVSENAHLFACCYMTDSNGEAVGQPEYGNKLGDYAFDYEFNYITDDGSVKLSDLLSEGKLVIINFWGTWCPYCIYELPDFDRVASEYGSQVSVIAVHTSNTYGAEDPAEYINSNFSESEINFVFDKADGDNDEYYGMLGGKGSYPMTLILDVDGVILFKQVGMMEYDDIIAALGFAEE